MTNNNDLLNQDMEFDAAAVDTIDQSSVEGGGPLYPVIQWVYGNVKEKRHGGMDYLGGFFVKSDGVDGDIMTAAGWTKTTRTFESGADEEGYWKRDVALSIIAERRRWEVASDNGPRQVFPWDKYEAAKVAANGSKTPHGRNQYLVLVKGMEDVPFVLTMKGAAAQSFESYRDGKAVLSRFANSVIRAANNASDAAAKKAGKAGGKRWPFRAFWLPVGAARDAQGEPTYTEVGKAGSTSKVVLPMALGLPDKPEGVELKKYYIGNTLLDRVNELYEASALWRDAWDNIKPGQSEGGDAQASEATQASAAQDAGVAAAEAMGL